MCLCHSTKGVRQTITKGPTRETNEKEGSESEVTVAVVGAIVESEPERESDWESSSHEEFMDDGPLIQIENGDDLRESCRQQ